jgi:hypothetical protein
VTPDIFKAPRGTRVEFMSVPWCCSKVLTELSGKLEQFVVGVGRTQPDPMKGRQHTKAAKTKELLILKGIS